MRMRRILIDIGCSTCSADIIHLDCLRKLKFDEVDLLSMSHPVVWFGGYIIHPVRTIKLPVRIHDKVKCNLPIDFLVVDAAASAYAIIDCHTLNKIRATITTHLMLMQFQCDDGMMSKIYRDNASLPSSL